MRLLLERGADVYHCNDSGRSALHYAAEYGRMAVVRFVINQLRDDAPQAGSKAKEFILLQDNDGYTAMHFAADSGSRETVEVLLEYPESLIVESTEFQMTPLQLAVSNGHADVVEYMLNSVEEMEGTVTNTELFNAKKLVTMQNTFGCTAIHEAASRGDSKTVRVLLQYPESLLITTQWGSSPLHQAASSGHADVIRLILEFLASTDSKKQLKDMGPEDLLMQLDSGGGTALHEAAINGYSEAVSILLQYAHNLTVQNNKGKTALHTAAEFGHPDVVRVILNAVAGPESTKYNCDVHELLSIRDKGGNTAHQLAVIKGNTSAATVIDDAIVEALSCTDPRIRDKHNRLPLYYASRSENPDVLRQFLEKFYKPMSNNEELDGVDDDDMCTALMYCAGIGNVTGVELLLQYGADARKPDCSGKMNILHYAIIQTVERPTLERSIISAIDVLIDHIPDTMLRSLCDQYMHMNCDLPPLSESSQQLITGMEADGVMAVSPVKLAAAAGAVEILEVLLERTSVYRNNIESVYDMKYIVPFPLLTDNYMESYNMEQGNSCCELISQYCKVDKIVKMLNITPLRVFLTKFSHIRTAVFYIIFVLHIVHMTCFSVSVLPTCDVDVSLSSPGTEPKFDEAFAAFLLWPAVVLLFEILCLIKIVRNEFIKRKNRSNFYDLYPKRKLELNWIETVIKFPHIVAYLVPEYFKNDKLPTSSYVKYFERLSHMSAIIFSASTFVWFNEYLNFDPVNSYNYVQIVFVVLVFGWLQTLEFVKGFLTIHAFVVMLKVVFVKDVLRILVVYVFVQVGVAFAVNAVVLKESPWTASDGVMNGTNPTCLIYQIFAKTFSYGNLFSVSIEGDTESEEVNPSVIRLLFALYICLTAVVLMNILIARMNNTYAEVVGLKESLWCVENLNFVIWIAEDNVLWIRTVFKKILQNRIFKMDENCRQQLKEKFVYTDDEFKFPPLIVTKIDRRT